MDLHHADSIPDWEKVNPADWNKWQRRAAETNGWDTIGNRISAAGTAMVLAGCELLRQDNVAAKATGTALVATGRILDKADGHYADKTGTKSRRNGKLDTLLDKVQMAKIVSTFKSLGILSSPEAAVVGIQQSINAGIGTYAEANGKDIRLAASNKYGIGLLSGGLVVKAIGHTVEKIHPVYGRTISRTGSAVVWASVGTSLFGTYNIARQVFTPDDQPVVDETIEHTLHTMKPHDVKRRSVGSPRCVPPHFYARRP